MWFEDGALHSITIRSESEREKNKTELTRRRIIIQTMPSSIKMPEALANILEEYEFEKVYSHQVVSSRR